ncbi:MAG: TfoX/Sxy family protein [Robiginitalea sp.]|jgi:TfoX/Sxy family transcriptional regulator of competence genes
MSYNQALEARINRLWLEDFPLAQAEIVLKNMFGGLAYLFRGKMTVGIIGDSLMVRVPGDKIGPILEEDAVRPMDFTGRPMKEFIFVEPEGYRQPDQLLRWLRLGLQHAKIQLEKSENSLKK